MSPTGAQIDLLARVTQIVSCAPVRARGLFWDVGMIKHRSSADTNWSAVAREWNAHATVAL